MKKYLLACLSIVLLASVAVLTSCSDDESFDAPTLVLSQTEVTASPGDDVTVNVTTTTDGGFKSLVVTKFWDGTPQGTPQTFDSPITSLTYTVTEADADHIVTLNFKLTDNKGKTDEKELVISVELTPLQILLKYNWRLDQEIRKKTNLNDIADAYTDDVYRFNADGTYNKSIGAKVDDFGDIWYNYCYYDLNQNTLRLMMSRTGAFGEEEMDILDITVIDASKLYANVTYYGLDIFDPTYDPEEEYEKRFVAVAKTANFDPYLPGPDDDETGPAGFCAEVEFDND
ncbi:MAG: hypothetical protein KF845_10640 [Cyclobacteriaceae bacterium]|nr:hypothetical protein [Cyclobacteriaceae bacterium]